MSRVKCIFQYMTQRANNQFGNECARLCNQNKQYNGITIMKNMQINEMFTSATKKKNGIFSNKLYPAEEMNIEQT